MYDAYWCLSLNLNILDHHLDGKCHIYDSLYLLIHYIYGEYLFFLTHCAFETWGDTTLLLCDTCDTFLLRLSWLVSCSDEEGNIRRMIYVDDSWYLWLTASFAFNSADSCSPSTSLQAHLKQETSDYTGVSLLTTISIPSIMLLNNTI